MKTRIRVAFAFSIALAACSSSTQSNNTGVPSLQDASSEVADSGSSDSAAASDAPSDATNDASSDVGDSGAVDGEANTALAILPAPTTTLPPLHVVGNTFQDPSGNTIILRGVAIPDIASVALWSGG